MRAIAFTVPRSPGNLIRTLRSVLRFRSIFLEWNGQFVNSWPLWERTLNVMAYSKHPRGWLACMPNFSWDCTSIPVGT